MYFWNFIVGEEELQMDMQSLWREAVIFAGESQETGHLILMSESKWTPAPQKHVSHGILAFHSVDQVH